MHGVRFTAKLLNVVCLFMRYESVNDQGVKIKRKHSSSDRFTHRLVTKSLWLQTWCKLYLARLIMSKKHHRECLASIIRYKLSYAPLCKCRKVSVFSRHHEIILCVFAVNWNRTEFQFRLNSKASGRNQIWVCKQKGVTLYVLQTMQIPTEIWGARSLKRLSRI